MSYHIEYAKSNRSKCKGPKKLCPSDDRVIKMGELRFGVEVETGSFTNTSWKHWVCVTPKVIENMKEKLSGPEEVQGFDFLKQEDADRVQRAWDNGEIPEEDKSSAIPKVKSPDATETKSAPTKRKRKAKDEPEAPQDTPLDKVPVKKQRTVRRKKTTDQA